MILYSRLSSENNLIDALEDIFLALMLVNIIGGFIEVLAPRL